MPCPHCGAENDQNVHDCAACGQPLGLLIPGQLLAARFEVLSRIGSGGMGVVYKAQDRELEEVVAVKVLRSDLAHSEEMARRFRSEIKLARRVRHPHVCGIHEYGQDGPLRFIVMEYVEGVDLKRVLAKGPIPHEKAFDIGMQIAGALAAIHEAGIAHRDLKPANVMLDAQDRVHLMDFGIAKQFGQAASSGLTATGMIVGTPEYMSPEQVRGEPLDESSDIYSLGVVLFELFAGRVPFRGTTAMATLYEHVHSPVPLDAARAAGAPEAVLPILERALAKSAADRYRAASELDDALRDARREPAPALRTEPETIAVSPGDLVAGDLVLNPEAALLEEQAHAPTLPAGRPTAVAARSPAPAPSRRPYAGRPPHLRAQAAAGAEPAGGRRWLAASVAACAVAAVAAVGWLYAPQLRELLTPSAAPGPGAPTPAATAPASAAPRLFPATGPPATLAAPMTPPSEPSPLPAGRALATVPPAAAPPVATPAAGVSPPPATPPPEQPSPRPQSPARASVERAEELFAAGRFGSALAEARAVLEGDPGNGEARQLAEDCEVELLVERKLKEARSALASGNRELALASVEAGLAAKPTDARLVALKRELAGN